MKYVILPVLLLAALAAGADVGVDTILAPVGTIDSDQVVIPAASSPTTPTRSPTSGSTSASSTQAAPSTLIP